MFSEFDTDGAEANGHTTQLADRFEAALLALDPFISERIIVQAVASSITGIEIQTKIIAPAMHEMGRLWASGKISLSEEHCASEICLRMLPIVRPSLQAAAPHSRERILISTVAGERHVIGTRMAADVLEGAGYDVHFLGADVPPGELVATALSAKADVVGIGITMPENIPALETALSALVAASPRTAVVLGGTGVPQGIIDGGWPCVTSVAAAVHTFEQAIEDVRSPDATTRLIPPTLDGNVDLGVGAASRVRANIHAAEERINQSRDLLTDLPNRQAMFDHLLDLQQHADFEATDFAMAALSVDGMRSVNETHGRRIGDTVLVRVAQIIQGKLRENDFVARIDGNKIAILFSRTGVVTAIRLVERLRMDIKALTDIPSVTASVGVTAFEGSARACMVDVENAVSDAKRTGGDNVHIGA